MLAVRQPSGVDSCSCWDAFGLPFVKSRCEVVDQSTIEELKVNFPSARITQIYASTEAALPSRFMTEKLAYLLRGCTHRRTVCALG